MYNNKSFLAIIPARGGSKRLPKKNILDLLGKPLIAWSIEAGLKSKYIDKVIVSSDDEKILKVAKEYGANTIKRPEYLANDMATTFDTLKHTVDNIENYDYIILLQPTSPLRNEVHIDESIELLDSKNADAIISVCKMEHSPQWSNSLPDDDNMGDFIADEIKNIRSQDLEPFYRLNGAIYICEIGRFLKEESLFIKDKIFAYKMDKYNSVDIDEEIDFKIAQFFAKEMN